MSLAARGLVSVAARPAKHGPSTTIIQDIGGGGDADSGVTLFYDDFSSRSSGSIPSKSMNGVSWGASNGSRTPAVSGLISRVAGTNSLMFSFLTGIYGGGQDAWSEQRFTLGSEYTNLYFRYYVYLPSGSDGTDLGPEYLHRDTASSDNNKFFRLWDVNYNAYYIKGGCSTQVVASTPEDPKIILEWGKDKTGSAPNNGGPSVGPSGAEWSKITDSWRGRWIKVEIHAATASSANNDGVLELRLDGVSRASTTTIPWYPVNGTNNYFRNGYLFGWANSGFTTNTNTFISEFMISTGSWL